MKIEITTTGASIDPDNIKAYLEENYGKVLSKYPVTFLEEVPEEGGVPSSRAFVELESLEDLLDLQQTCGKDLIISRNEDKSEGVFLEIYDDFRETFYSPEVEGHEGY